MENLDFSNLDIEVIILMVLSAGIGTFLKDVVVGGLTKLKAFVLKTENKIDDKLLEIILTASKEAAEKAASEVAPATKTTKKAKAK